MQFSVKVKGEGQSLTEFSAFSSSCCVNWVSKSTKKKLDTTSDLGGSVGGRSVREDVHPPPPLTALPLRSLPPRHAEELLIAAGGEKDHKRETGVKKNHASGERKRGEERGRERGEKKRGEGRRGEEKRKEGRGGEKKRGSRRGGVKWEKCGTRRDSDGRTKQLFILQKRQETPVLLLLSIFHQKTNKQTNTHANKQKTHGVLSPCHLVFFPVILLFQR